MTKENVIEVAVADVVDFMRITGRFAPALHAVIERAVTAQAAKKAGLRISVKELQKGADVFRAAHDLTRAADMKRWFSSSGITQQAFEDYIEANLLISKFKDRLLKKNRSARTLASPIISASIREVAYQDWLKDAVK